MRKWIFKVESNCSDASRENEFNEWYNNVHVPDLLKEEVAFVGAYRYQAVDSQPNQGKFVAIFELDTDDIAQAMAMHEKTEENLKKRGRISPLLKITSRSAYRMIAEAQ